MPTTVQIESFAETNLRDRERSSLDAASAADATEIFVQSTEGFTASQAVFVGQPSREGCERAVILTVDSATKITLTSGLKLAHGRLEPVFAVIGDFIHIYRAANIDGSVPDDSMFSVLATRSIDPDQQSTYYSDSSGGSNYWYKLTYYSPTANVETALSDAVPRRGSDFGHYTSISAIRTEAGLERAYNLSDTAIDQQRVAAETEINTSLAGAYTVPFLKPVPPAIRTITTQLAAALLLVNVYGGQADRYDKQLKDVRARIATMAESQTLTDDAGVIIGDEPGVNSSPDDCRDRRSDRQFRMGDIF